MNDLTVITPETSGALTVADVESVLGYARNEKSAATRIACASDRKDFEAWCDLRGACPLPASPAGRARLRHRSGCNSATACRPPTCPVGATAQ